MNNAFRRELEEFQNFATGLQSTLSELQSARPEHAEASDGQGAVQVRVDGSGLPQGIRVSSDWQKRCRPDGLGLAVAEAAGRARLDLMEAWSRNLPNGPWSAGHGLGSMTIAPEPPRNGQEAGISPERDTRYVISRPIDQLVEDAITALDNAGNFELTLDQEAQASGSDSARRVTVTLTESSLVSCVVDTSWASRASVNQINHVLGEALEGARSALTRSSLSEQATTERQQLDGLFDEAFAILRDPGRIKNL